jgi:hypothetical protein
LPTGDKGGGVEDALRNGLAVAPAIPAHPDTNVQRARAVFGCNHQCAMQHPSGAGVNFSGLFGAKNVKSALEIREEKAKCCSAAWLEALAGQPSRSALYWAFPP